MSQNSAFTGIDPNYHFVTVIKRLHEDDRFELHPASEDTNMETEYRGLVQEAIEQQLHSGALSFVPSRESGSGLEESAMRSVVFTSPKSSKCTSTRAKGTMSYKGTCEGWYEDCDFEVALCHEVPLSKDQIESIQTSSVTGKNGSDEQDVVTFRPSKVWIDKHVDTCHEAWPSLMRRDYLDDRTATPEGIPFFSQCRETQMPCKFTSVSLPSEGVWSINGQEFLANNEREIPRITSRIHVRVHEPDDSAPAQSDDGGQEWMSVKGDGDGDGDTANKSKPETGIQ